MSAMIDDQVRAELERIEVEGLGRFDLRDWYNTSISLPSHYVDSRILPVLRRLAKMSLQDRESQQVLGRISKKRPHRYHEKTVGFVDCPQCEAMIGIAYKARKGDPNA